MLSRGLLLLPGLLAAPGTPGPGREALLLHQMMTSQERHYYFGEEGPGNYEVADIEEPTLEADGSRSLSFQAHDKTFQLRLQPNTKLLAPQAVVVRRTVSPEGATLDLERVGDSAGPCHFLHKDEETVAALSLCAGQQVQGLVMSGERSIEILPLNPRLKRMMCAWKNDTSGCGSDVERGSRESKMIDFSKRNLHLVKRNQGSPMDLLKQQGARAEHSTKEWTSVNLQQTAANSVEDQYSDDIALDREANRTVVKRGGKNRLLETAVFLDAAAYHKFATYFQSLGKTDVDVEVRRLVLSYLNGIQAIYMLGSLGEQIDFSILRLEMARGYDPYRNAEGDREPLLNSFCEYQESQNPKSDAEPGHWDLALLVSALNFYAVDGSGRKNGVTMGLARVGGMCTMPHNCVIGELGVTNSQGKPYPSAGFTAVYVMAHEVGHNLGMHHDSSVGCDKDGFIMSPSRGTKGESRWSSCSVRALRENSNLGCLDDNSASAVERLDIEAGVFAGEVWSATRQCQVFLLDQDAQVDHTEDTFAEMCESIKCRTPRRDGYYRSGPALEGTACGQARWCMAGECVINSKAASPASSKPGEWSEWQWESCQSGCIQGSQGFREKKRQCQTSRLVHTLEGCRGPSTGIDFCEDSGLCGGRVDTSSYATQQCQQLAGSVPAIDPAGQGTQVSHSTDRLWQACAIYCKKRHGGWYTPRMDLNDQPHLSPYFPDGTLCHQEDSGVKYFCQRNMCLEENSRVAKSTEPDLNLFLNANPGHDLDHQTPDKLLDYFTLNDNLTPVGGQFAGLEVPEVGEDAWSVKDYIE